jgi:DSF synthase
MNAIVDFPTLGTTNAYTQLDIKFDSELQTVFNWMLPRPRACFNITVLEEIARMARLLESHQGHINNEGQPTRVDFVVLASHAPGVFNLGGDLNVFMPAIMRKDRALLERYAELCVEDVYRYASGFNSQVTTIALVQGKALGGGFEAALACDTIVAERSSTFSFPEILFNLFPGMGALSMLTRMIGAKKAEEIINSGFVYSAQQMHDMGVVDVLVDDGAGLEETRHLIQQRRRRMNSHRALKLAKQQLQSGLYEELRNIVKIWVDAALQLETKDLRMMARLLQAQNKMSAASAEDAMIEGLYGVPSTPAVACSAMS